MYGNTPSLERESLKQTSSLFGAQALAGVANGVEVWGAYGKDNSDFKDKMYSGGGKFQLPMQDKNVNVAVGASYRQASGNFTQSGIPVYEDLTSMGLATDAMSQKATDLDAYLVATADLSALDPGTASSTTRFLGTAGVLYKRLKFTDDENTSIFDDGGNLLQTLSSNSDSQHNLIRPFVGLELATPDKSSVGVEYRMKDSTLDAKAVMSFVVRHELGQGLTVQVGTTNADPLGLGTEKQNFFAMVGYNLMGGK